MTERAENFDWVTAHSQCSLDLVFESLRLQVQTDVETREALRPKDQRHSHYAFRFVSNERKFSAMLNGHRIRRVASFSLERHAIVVRDENDTEMFSATTTLNDEGDCRLKVKDQERELWQVRKLALEGLLFGGAEWAT
jgi:hypothetical protein